MITRRIMMLAALSTSATNVSASVGRLGTLPHGIYACSLPGDANGPAWRELPDKGFSIGNASTYRTSKGSGTYLLTGMVVTFTRGSMKGMVFDRVAKTTLIYRQEDGKRGRVSCVRMSAADRS